MPFWKAVGKYVKDEYGNLLDPTNRNVQLKAMKMLDAGNNEPHLAVQSALKAPKQSSGNSTPRMAGEVFTKPVKESAEITSTNNEMSLLNDPRSLHGTSSSPRIIQHAGNVVRDRVYGENEEQDFLTLLAGSGIIGDLANKGTVLKVGNKRLVLPDTQANGLYFENKIKYPTPSGYFGLEDYRFDSLKQLQSSVPGYEQIYYVINPNVRANTNNTERGLANIEQAGLTKGQRIIASIDKLKPDYTQKGFTYRDSGRTTAPTHYFHASQFQPFNIDTFFNV